MRGGRGSWGGRGRGGGRGGGGGSSRGPDVIGDTAEELGMTYMQMESLGNQPPPLYPPIEYPAVSELSDKDGYLINKMRELAYRMTLSSHFMEDNLEKDDESVLFSDTAGKRDQTKDSILTTLTQASAGFGTFFPAELLVDRKTLASAASLVKGGQVKKKALLTTFEQLEAKEKIFKSSATEAEKEHGNEAEEEEEEEEEAWEEDEGDYDKDYYGSGGEEEAEEDGGDEGVF